MKAQGILRTYLACISSTNHRNFFGLICQFPKFLGLLIKRDIYKSKNRLISKLLSPFPQLPHGLGKPTKLKTKSHESVDRIECYMSWKQAGYVWIHNCLSFVCSFVSYKVKYEVSYKVSYHSAKNCEPTSCKRQTFAASSLLAGLMLSFCKIL